MATSTLPGQLTSADPLGAGRDAHFDDYVLLATEGQPVTLALNSDEFDTYLQIFDLDSGNFVAFNDDSGVSSNAQLTFTPQPGIRYRVRTTSFDRAVGNYTLTASNPADLSLEPVPPGTELPALTVTETRSGQLTSLDFLGERGTHTDNYQLGPIAGVPVKLELVSNEFDPYIQVFETETQNLVAFNNDSAGSQNSAIEFIPETGVNYEVSVTSFTIAEGNYTLSATSLVDFNLDSSQLGDFGDFFGDFGQLGENVNFVSVGPGETIGSVTQISSPELSLNVVDNQGIIGQLIQNIAAGQNPTFINNINLLRNYEQFADADRVLNFVDLSDADDVHQISLDFLRKSANLSGLRALGGNDNVVGSPTNNIVNGNTGDDTLTGGGAADYLRGGRDGDDINGSAGDDLLNGNRGNDVVRGGAGNDFIRGGQDNDLLIGGEGDDILAGDKGSDRLFGGSGADTFILRSDVAQLDPALADSILDFDGSDRIGLTDGLTVDSLSLDSSDVNGDGTSDTVIRVPAANNEVLGVVLSVAPASIRDSFFTIQFNDPIMNIVG